MRSGLVSIVAAGVLALGAVPATLALADEDATKKADRDAGGPPSWAPAHGHDKTGPKGPKGAAKRAEKAQALKDKREQQTEWAKRKDPQGPPPWATAHGKQGNKAEQKGAHATGMKAWSACVTAAEAAPTEAEKREAKSRCEKPAPPGHAR